MKKKIIVILIMLFLLTVLIGVYWFKRGDACFTQPPFYNCHTQNKFDDIELAQKQFFDWISHQSKPSIFSVDENEGLFTFDHIGDVGWTRIVKNNEVKGSLGFYTNHTEPILTPLSENTLIGSAWQWSKDSRLRTGPFFNYLINFSNKKTIELETEGKLIAKSSDGQKIVFLESECVKNPASMEIDHNCNNQNLSLRLINLTADISGHVIDHYNETKMIDFGKMSFSPQGNKLAFEAKIESIGHDTKKGLWRLFVVDAVTGEIIEQNNTMSINRYSTLFWIDNKNIIYW